MSGDRLLDGKTAIVTGGSKGVGRGIARAFARAGARIAILGRTAGPLERCRDELADLGAEALAVAGDVTVPEDRTRLVEATLARFGSIDVLVNNAALVPHGTLLEIDDAQIEGAWQSTVIAPLMLMRLCHPHLRQGGSIINISSGASTANSVPQRGIYAAVKSGLNAISRAAANEWGAEGIRVNTIMPFARTEALAAFFDAEPEMAQQLVAHCPLGRAGDPESDIGGAAVFLASDMARYLTGAILPLDGGMAFIR